MINYDKIPEKDEGVYADDKNIIQTASKPSIELSRNAKGIYSWKIKCYDEDLVNSFNEIKIADDALKLRYGLI